MAPGGQTAGGRAAQRPSREGAGDQERGETTLDRERGPSRRDDISGKPLSAAGEAARHARRPRRDACPFDRGAIGRLRAR